MIFTAGFPSPSSHARVLSPNSRTLLPGLISLHHLLILSSIPTLVQSAIVMSYCMLGHLLTHYVWNPAGGMDGCIPLTANSIHTPNAVDAALGVCGGSASLKCPLYQEQGHEAQEQGIGGLLLIAVGMGLGYHLVAGHIEHGTASKAQHDRQHSL